MECVAGCCSVLQCVAVCCSVLQCAAVCCSALQCSRQKYEKLTPYELNSVFKDPVYARDVMQRQLRTRGTATHYNTHV